MSESERERLREISEWYRRAAGRGKPAVEQGHITSAATVKTKLIEKKEKITMSEKSYHIGTILPEAVRAFADLYGLTEAVGLHLDESGLSIRSQGQEKGYHVGTILPEAKQAWLNLKEARNG